jgi:hypothetical protein
MVGPNAPLPPGLALKVNVMRWYLRAERVTMLLATALMMNAEQASANICTVNGPFCLQKQTNKK